MRLINYFLTTIVFLTNTGCTHSQSKDEQIIAMLKKFYIEYNEVWANTSYSIEELNEELFALQRNYCSEKLQEEAKEYYEKETDSDLFIKNWSGENLEKLKATLQVERDKTNDDIYIVSYMVELVPPNPPRDVKNVIHVKVIEEDGSYKIDEVW